MITSWFCLNKLAHYLNQSCADLVIEKALSYKKNELLLLSADSQRESIQITLFDPFQYILLRKTNEPRRHIKIFSELDMEIIDSIKLSSDDRDLIILFRSGAEICIHFRSRSGNISFLNSSDNNKVFFKKNKT